MSMNNLELRALLHSLGAYIKTSIDKAEKRIYNNVTLFYKSKFYFMIFFRGGHEDGFD